MIVGIDAHTVGHRHTGNETYVTHLLNALHALDSHPPLRAFLTSEGMATGKIPSGDGLTHAQVPASAWLRFAAGMSWAMKRHPVDLLHVQYAAPLGVKCRLVTTIHDISYIHLPQQMGTLGRLRVEQLFPATARRSDVIITCSQATKDDIIEHFKIPEEKIVITPYGVSPVFRRIEDRQTVDATLAGLGLESGYILYVGTLQPRKNIVRLLRAFDLLKQSEHIPEKLVITGKRAWLYQDILDTHASLDSREDVIFTGHVADQDLPYVFNGAKLFVYPSLIEGFGLPPLEAMACGTAVAVSKAPAIPEVVGDAGVYFDPYSVESIATAIHDLLVNDSLRHELEGAGMRRATQFDWSDTAQRTLEVYQRAMQ